MTVIFIELTGPGNRPAFPSPGREGKDFRLETGLFRLLGKGLGHRAYSADLASRTAEANLFWASAQLMTFRKASV